jgi:hypothetical protein
VMRTVQADLSLVTIIHDLSGCKMRVQFIVIIRLGARPAPAQSLPSASSGGGNNFATASTPVHCN